MNSYSLDLLVVAEEPDLRERIGKLGERLGCNIIEAFNSHDGLAKAHKLQPDIIVVNFSLPGMDGVQLIRAIRADPDGKRPHIILMTYPADQDKQDDGFNAGADDFIGHPAWVKVTARLQAGLRLIRLQRERERHLNEMKLYCQDLAHSKLTLRKLTMTDALTGLPNRRYAMKRIQGEWAASHRRHSQFCCMAVVLEGLREINEAYKLERGDVVLKTVAAFMKRALRTRDIVCRISGNDFLIIRPNISLDRALVDAERLLSEVHALGIHTDACPLGLSIGLAESRDDVLGPQELLRLAEQGAQLAKIYGGNRVYSLQRAAAKTTLPLYRPASLPRGMEKFH